MSQKTELEQLYKRNAELKQQREKHQLMVVEIKAANYQPNASFQQLKATKQQLQAYNEQLQASEEEIRLKEAMARSASDYSGNIINTIRHSLHVLDENLLVVSANRFFKLPFLWMKKKLTLPERY